MKSNITYYPHNVDSHNNWKFKTLRKRFGWAGEGQFWALLNLIGDSENCWLSLEDDEKINSISADLDLTPDEFQEYINFLVSKCKLLILEGNKITSETAQETLNEVMSKRKYQRGWKKKESIENENSIVDNKKSSIENEKSNIEKQQSKVKKSKVNDDKSSGPPTASNFSQIKGFIPLPEIKALVLKDEAFVRTFYLMGIQDNLPDWLQAFHRWLEFTGETIKQERDYRTHFKNWIKKQQYRSVDPNGFMAKEEAAPGRMRVMEYFMGGTIEWTESQYQQYCKNPAASGYTFLRYAD